MDNSVQHLRRDLEKIPSKELRALSYLLCQEPLQSNSIEEKWHYPVFDPNGSGQYSLDFYKELRDEDLTLLESINPKTALGRYTERLLAAWFMINPMYELLAFNLQLIENGLTLGEIDFLIWEKQNRKAIHLEFALKFYLAIEINGVYQFIGPKSRDTLSGKSKKLMEHQLRLCENYLHLVEERLQAYSFEPRLMLKGILFFPFSRKDKKERWLRRSELSMLLDLDLIYYVLEKRKNWIYPYDEKELHQQMNCKELMDYCSDDKWIPLMAVVEGTQDLELLMLVDDNWPTRE